ncbi:hypothetical protein [Elioraea sp.]|uniref:hypothetical protein n=1 Tax=Elioraea sp. TaxID=2185103 RepID=UPI00307EC4FB
MSAAPDTGTPAPAPAERPAHVPEKFWDPEKSAIRTDVLLTSYAGLERLVGMPAERQAVEYREHLRRELAAEPGAPAGEGAAGEVPASPEGYIAALPPELLAYHGVEPTDPTVAALAGVAHELGLPVAAAAEGLTLALERIAPQPDQAAEDARIASELERLGETVEAGAERAVALRDRLLTLLSPEDAAALAGNIETAEAAFALERLLHRINQAWPEPEPLRERREAEPARDQREHGRAPAPRDLPAEQRDRLRSLLDAAEAAPAFSPERAAAERSYAAEMRRLFPDYGR